MTSFAVAAAVVAGQTFRWPPSVAAFCGSRPRSATSLVLKITLVSPPAVPGVASKEDNNGK